MAIFNLEASNIENLDLKLEGKLPVNRDELLFLVNSWGRNGNFDSYDKDNERIYINCCEIKEKYELSKLDVSEITNFKDIFYYSNFNGDISKWDVSNAISMSFMFYETKEFNYSLNSWDISKVTNMSYMFEKAKAFNQALLWDLSKVESCRGMFSNSIAFEKKFNNENHLSYETSKIKSWLIKNRALMEAMSIEDNKSKELEEFLSNLNVITSTKLNGLHNDEIKEII